MSIHKAYTHLSKEEKTFVDRMFSQETFRQAEAELGYPLLGDDNVEQAVEAVSLWLIASANYKGVVKTPYEEK